MAGRAVPACRARAFLCPSACAWRMARLGGGRSTTPTPLPRACVRLACAACMRGAARAAARRAASARCTRACLCRFACAQERGRRTRHRDLPPTSPQTPPHVHTHVHEEARFERPSSPPGAGPSHEPRGIAAPGGREGRGGGAPSTATTTTSREQAFRLLLCLITLDCVPR